jgi:hypothetical protein
MLLESPCIYSAMRYSFSFILFFTASLFTFVVLEENENAKTLFGCPLFTHHTHTHNFIRKENAKQNQQKKHSGRQTET